jgi:uncharacterized protein DUF3606
LFGWLDDKPLAKHGPAFNPQKPPVRDRALIRRSTWIVSRREQPDRSKINMHQPHEVKYWTHALKVSKDVDKVGNSAAAVRKELGRLGTWDQ